MTSSVTQAETTSSTHTLARKKLALLGCGKLGTILLQAFLERGLVSKDEAIATVQHENKCQSLSDQLGGVILSTNNREAVVDAPIVLICVKPQAMPQLLAEIAPLLKPGTLVISAVTAATLPFIQQQLGKDVAVIRAMPNTPAMVGAGMTGLAAGASTKQEHLETAKNLFESVGRVAVVDEKHMDAITALSASGPAFVYIIIESFVEAGVKVGLPRDVATQLAAQMVLGASSMVLETGEHPAKLKDIVTTPAGCTIDGILELEDGGLRVTLIKAVVRATHRAKELVNG